MAVLLLTFGGAWTEARQVDSRWAPWLGCWQLTGEAVRVCVDPAADAAGVVLRTFVAGDATQEAGADAKARTAALEQTIIADGAQHPVSEAECRGWQRAEWSESGERLFARAELTCGGGNVRRVSGLSMIVAGTTWIDVQGIDIDGRENVRVRRYRRAADRADTAAAPPRAAVARQFAAAAFTVEDVKEASRHVSPRVVQAALTETAAEFDLDSRTLIDLTRSGVAANVIDVMIALSYPRHFVVGRPADLSASSWFGPGLDDPWLDPWGWSAAPFLWPYYASWGRRVSPYDYSPFGYAYWAGYGGSTFFPGSGFLIIDVGEPASGEAGSARAISGVGYTRIRPRSAATERTESAGRTTSGTSTDSSGASSARSGSSGSSSGSSGASPAGFSSGASSTDTGRTAQPR
ncbi:MAG: hypothetical protein HY657_16900 [Acidobacteria bacterium]|nr:hypothetical protein [Acidobacteriota bacterium]